MRVPAVLVCALLISFTYSAGQSQQARIGLQSNVAMPGETAKILLELETGGKKISLIEGEVTFPSFLTFVGLEAGMDVEAGSLKSKADLLPEKSADGSQKLDVTIQTTEGKFFPDGIVAAFTFQMASDLKKEGQGPLENHLSLAGPGGESIPAEITSGSMTIVLAAPVATCFFYMH